MLHRLRSRKQRGLRTQEAATRTSSQRTGFEPVGRSLLVNAHRATALGLRRRWPGGCRPIACAGQRRRRVGADGGGKLRCAGALSKCCYRVTHGRPAHPSTERNWERGLLRIAGRVSRKQQRSAAQDEESTALAAQRAPWPAILRCSPQKRAIRVSVIRGTGRPNGKRESALTSERSASERHAQQGCDGRAARTLQRSHGATECRKWGSSSRRNMEKGGPGARQAPRRTHSHCPRPRSTSGRAAG